MPCFFSSCSLRSIPDIAGTRVRAIIRLAMREKAIVSAISVNSCLVMPSVNRMGINTQIVVIVEDVIAPATWLAPDTAAFRRETPRDLRR